MRLGSAGEPLMWYISQPAKCGSLTSHLSRLPSAVRMNAPLRVPTRTRTLLIASAPGTWLDCPVWRDKRRILSEMVVESPQPGGCRRYAMKFLWRQVGSSGLRKQLTFVDADVIHEHGLRKYSGRVGVAGAAAAPRG